MTTRTVVLSTSAGLRAQTRQEHEAVEAALDISRLRTCAGLVAVLLGWVAVWNQVRVAVGEPEVAAEATAELLPPSAQALEWLAADLDDLADLAPAPCEGPPHHMAAADLQVLRELLGHPSGSWGLAYVLRGSRLGGGVLAPRVRDALELPGERGTRFLASWGTDPGREWVCFRRRLDAADLSAPQVTVAVESARWAFGWVGATMAVTSGRPAPAAWVS